LTSETVFIANRKEMNGLDTPTAWLSHVLDRLSHLRRANTIDGSRKNIQSHYDLSNDMFELFLVLLLLLLHLLLLLLLLFVVVVVVVE